jgi:deoxyadenosine/deoxycytidine kinase
VLVYIETSYKTFKDKIINYSFLCEQNNGINFESLYVLNQVTYDDFVWAFECNNIIVSGGLTPPRYMISPPSI